MYGDWDSSCVRGVHYVADELGALEVHCPGEELDYCCGALAFCGADDGHDAVGVVAGSMVSAQAHARLCGS
jgi:hypothetical protein